MPSDSYYGWVRLHGGTGGISFHKSRVFILFRNHPYIIVSKIIVYLSGGTYDR